MGESHPDNAPVPHRITVDGVEIRDDLTTALYTVWRALRHTPGSTPRTLDQCPGRIVAASIDDIVRDLWATLDDTEIAGSAAAVQAHLHQSGHLDALPGNLVWVCDDWNAPRRSPHHTQTPAPAGRPGESDPPERPHGPVPGAEPTAAPDAGHREAPSQPDQQGHAGHAGHAGSARTGGAIGGGGPGGSWTPQAAAAGEREARQPDPAGPSLLTEAAGVIELLRRLVADHDAANRLREAVRHHALPLLYDIDRRLVELLNELPADEGEKKPAPAESVARTTIAEDEIRQLAGRIRTWDADRNRIQHAENHEGGAYGQWHGSDDWAVDIVRDVQDIIGDSARSRPVKHCPPGNECEDCAEIPADETPSSGT